MASEWVARPRAPPFIDPTGYATDPEALTRVLGIVYRVRGERPGDLSARSSR
jgi:hypothetical protein